MNRVPSPFDAREDVRAETRASEVMPNSFIDDGRQRHRTGDAAINPYDLTDIMKMYAPTNGTGSQAQIAKEVHFEWKAYETYGKSNHLQLIAHEQQGWRPVMHSDFPGRFAPMGTEGKVHVNDMLLMHRPMRLTVQARQEEYTKATRAMQMHRQKMAEAPEGQAPRTTPVVRTSREAIDIPE